AYGLRDPFDAPAAIDAQAHLMADLLRQFGSVSLALAAYNAGPGAVAACECVPQITETQAYVARILGLMGGAGELAAPALEVRLVGGGDGRGSARPVGPRTHARRFEGGLAAAEHLQAIGRSLSQPEDVGDALGDLRPASLAHGDRSDQRDHG